MFTGLVQSVGVVSAAEKSGDLILTIKAPSISANLTLGASVACHGVCLTVIEMGADSFKVQLSAETLAKTTAKHWKVGTHLNLERALRAGDELGGHYVSGHVDGVARVARRQPEGDSVRYFFEVPAAFARYLAPKGSITLDGVSLTVNEVENCVFGVNLIPHTLQVTTLAALQVGDDVNFEIDMVARYVERMLAFKEVA